MKQSNVNKLNLLNKKGKFLGVLFVIPKCTEEENVHTKMSLSICLKQKIVNQKTMTQKRLILC